MLLEPVDVDPRVKSWKDVLRNLIFHANEDGVAWPCVDTIRRETGYKSAKAVRDALSALEGLCLGRRVRAGVPGAARVSYRSNVTAETVSVLSDDMSSGVADIGGDMLISGGGVINRVEVTSTSAESPGRKVEVTSTEVEVTSREVEVTSQKVEVTSNRSNKEISKNNTYIHIAPKVEVTSTCVDNSPEEGPVPHGPGVPECPASPGNDAAGGGRQPPAVSAESILGNGGADYLSLCREPGWRPNDAARAPDISSARRAVIACAMMGGLSQAKAVEFWKRNAVRRWTGIDRGVSVADLVSAAAANWQRDDPKAYWAERRRRRQAAASRTIG